MAAIEEFVYSGRDNTIELVLSVDGVAVSHDDISRARVVLSDGTEVDSQTVPACFDFTQPDRLILRLGQAGLAAGRYSVRLVTYDVAHPNGLEWEPLMVVRVK